MSIVYYSKLFSYVAVDNVLSKGYNMGYIDLFPVNNNILY
jgi:hypothetical protein